MASQIRTELRKIPPVTRFLCASSLAVTLPILLNLVSGHKIVYVTGLVVKKFELWRLWTTFFYGGQGLGYVFGLFMLYRNSNELETIRYARKSADYAWQLILAATTILIFNLPLASLIHSRAFSLALTYLVASLSPPGSQSSLFGMITFPITWLPYILLGIDFINNGPGVVPSGISGIVAGHLWWWGIWGGPRAMGYSGPGYPGRFGAWGIAPRWLRSFVSEDRPTPGGTGGIIPRGPVQVHEGFGGVRVTAPRTTLIRPGGSEGTTSASTTGYQWGSGMRLGNR